VGVRGALTLIAKKQLLTIVVVALAPAAAKMPIRPRQKKAASRESRCTM
jgi:hypothetical protein